MLQEQKQNEVNYLAPFISLVILFFFVGFLTTANGQFQGPLKAAFLSDAGAWKNTFITMITFSWFLAYPLTGGIGTAWVTKYGYKGTLIRALIVMVFGLGIFWLSSWFTVQFPAAKAQIFAATATAPETVVPYGFFIFLIGSFVVGSAATILQVVINPYLTACNVKGTQPVQRLNIGGSSNSIGTTVAPFFVSGVVFGGLSMENVQVSQLQVPFICLAAVIALVTFILTRLSLPEIHGKKAAIGEKLEKSIWSFSHLTLGVITIFFYVGVEVCIGANLNLYVKNLIDEGRTFSLFGIAAGPALMATCYWGGMLIGRLTSSFLSNISPKVQLTVTAVAATTCVLAAMVFNNPWLLVVVGLFHSVMWGAIFTLCTHRLGKYTSIASGVFMIGVVGGAIIPLVQGMVADGLGNNWQWTWTIVLFGEAFILYYALIGSKVKQHAE